MVVMWLAKATLEEREKKKDAAKGNKNGKNRN